jgi:hypothetical protein
MIRVLWEKCHLLIIVYFLLLDFLLCQLLLFKTDLIDFMPLGVLIILHHQIITEAAQANREAHFHLI